MYVCNCKYKQITLQGGAILNSLFLPSGIMYHHDLEYMKKLEEKEVDPYHFHM